MKTCSYCESQNDDTVIACGRCGTTEFRVPEESISETAPPRSRVENRATGMTKPIRLPLLLVLPALLLLAAVLLLSGASKPQMPILVAFYESQSGIQPKLWNTSKRQLRVKVTWMIKNEVQKEVFVDIKPEVTAWVEYPRSVIRMQTGHSVTISHEDYESKKVVVPKSSFNTKDNKPKKEWQ